MFTTLIAIVFTLVLVAGVPALSYSTARNSEIRNMPRLGLYLSAVFSQWLLTVVGLGVVLLVAPRRFSREVLPPCPWPLTLEWGGGIAVAALLALGLVILVRTAWMAAARIRLGLPADSGNAREKLWAVLIVAPTAAFCEEFLFRGYLLTQLHDWLHSLLWAWVVSFGGVWFGALLPGMERHDARRTAGSAARLSRGAMGKPLSRHARALDDRHRGAVVARPLDGGE